MQRYRTSPSGVSIITPNWNHEYLLGRSIRSALKAVQALRSSGVPAEVIVIDDFSRDGSPTLLRQLEALYHQQHLRVRLLPKNNGPSQARNFALQIASYRYAVTLDADNEICAENLLAFYKSIVATEAAIVYGNIILLKDNVPFVTTSNESYDHVLPFTANPIDTMCMLDRLQLLEQGGYFDDSRKLPPSVEDWELHLNLANSGRLIIFVPMVFGYYHILQDSFHRQRNQAELDRQRKFLSRVHDQLGIRRENLLNTRHLTYHPELGYI
jgi:glycosyltransferase involved in cell wall biosynthesis